MNREHYVYRAYNADGELLYVGRTKNLERRWSEHKVGMYPFPAATARIKLSGPYSYETVRQLERDALASEDPMYGFTPRRHKAQKAVSRMQFARMEELISAGSDWASAAEQAIADIPGLPIHNRFEMPMTYEARKQAKAA